MREEDESNIRGGETDMDLYTPVDSLVIPLTCQDCGCQYEKWLPAGAIENNCCPSCNEAGWKKWEEDEADNLKRIEEIQKQGHSHHCACRQVWGDGECECDLYKQGYDPYAWMKGKGYRLKHSCLTAAVFG